MNIIRKARGEQIPKQAQRVFLCLDPKNIADKDKLISNIHDMKYGMDCVVSWLETQKDIDEEELRNELHDTHALVVWVTSELLQTVSTGKNLIEFQIARELKCPIIPIAKDSSLFPYFTELVDAIHGIAISDSEYHEKLKKQLETFLAAEELMKEIDEKAFTAKIFLSYRKMDIKKAREFMKKFHDLAGFEAISIWYDNFLTAGRVFDDEIKQSIIKSDAFTLLVTPNLLEKNDKGKDNYVVSTEYPFARDEGKPVVPVEAQKTDIELFERIFRGVEKAAFVDNTESLSAAFKTKLNNSSFEEKMDSERARLLGMAYLKGVGVEKDIDRAIKLLETCAKENDESAYRAARQLADIYFKGIDVNINYDKSLHWEVRTAAISEKIFGKGHINTAASYHKIALTHTYLCSFDEALEWFQKAIEINESVLGKNHLDIATAYNDIAVLYSNQAKYEIALKMHQKSLEIHEKILGKEHATTATTYHNIAVIYMKHGEYYTALEWYQKALEIREMVLGKEHPDTALTCNNIAVVYNEQCRFHRALDLHLEVLGIRKKALGEEHPDTADSYNNIASVYLKQNEYDKALELFNKALEIREKILGKEHLHTTATYNNIAAVYYNQGEYDKALKWYQKDLVVCEKVLGRENLDTATSYYNIAVLLNTQGKYDEALKYYQNVAEIYEKVLGKDHTGTASICNTIASVYSDQGKHDIALKWFIKSYQSLTHAVGNYHPNSLKVKSNIKITYSKCEHTEPFEDYLRKRLEENNSIV